MISFRHRSRSI